MRRTTIAIGCVLAALQGCGWHAGWMEGPRVDDEVRRVLASGDGGEMGIAANGGLYLVPPGKVEPERRALLDALLHAEPVPFRLYPLPDVRMRDEPAQLPPRWGDAIHAYTTPEVVEIRYPDCTCRVRRLDLGDGVAAYSVDLADRQSGSDRRYTYRMKLHASEPLDDAWCGLVSAVERGVAYRHYGGVASSSPFAALREVGVDAPDLVLRTAD